MKFSSNFRLMRFVWMKKDERAQVGCMMSLLIARMTRTNTWQRAVIAKVACSRIGGRMWTYCSWPWMNVTVCISFLAKTKKVRRGTKRKGCRNWRCDRNWGKDWNTLRKTKETALGTVNTISRKIRAKKILYARQPTLCMFRFNFNWREKAF